jgi:rhodanese-related sulfurtransferase
MKNRNSYTRNTRNKADNELTLGELYCTWQQLEQNEIIIDIRSADDFADAHVPGSRNIPFSSVIDRRDDLKGYRRVYFYCYGGKGSKEVACKLADMGFENVSYLRNAGLSDWQTAGHPVSH